jgi:hypothetical protein
MVKLAQTTCKEAVTVRFSKIFVTQTISLRLLTTTSSDFGLTESVAENTNPQSEIRNPKSNHFSGDFVGRVTPVPIPNTEVKPAGADGTARVTVWESRKSPGLNQSPLDSHQAGFWFLACLL